MSRLEMLEHYCERGKAEGHMGELKDVLAPALSSTNRPKSHWRRRAPQTSTPAIDAFACNEVRWLIALLGYEVMHIARRAMAQQLKPAGACVVCARACCVVARG
jgi:hypothetical protein